MTELPLVVVDVQRGGPSTGLPTKTEQADLLQAMFGRNGEAPVPIVAPQSPADCFDAAVEAARIAVTYRTPVMLLSDGYLANGSEPWRIPDVDELPDHRPGVRDRDQPPSTDDAKGEDKSRSSGPTCATRRPWPALGDPRHRRAWSTASAGWRRPTATATSPTTRPTTTSWSAPGQAKVDRIAESLPPLEVDDPVRQGARCWSSAGARPTARSAPRAGGCARRGMEVAQAHLRHLNPFPQDLGDILKRYDEVLIPEMNLGQLSMLHPREVPRRRGRLQPGQRHAAARPPSSPRRSPSSSSTPTATVRAEDPCYQQEASR